MRKQSWLSWIIAAVLILGLGVAIAAAGERVEVRVEKNGDDEVSVEINGVSEVIRIDDLADGESRSFDLGDHSLVVTRAGDALTVTSDGHGFSSFGGDGDTVDHLVWIGDDGEEIELDGEHRIVKKMVVTTHGEDGGDGTQVYTIHMDGDEADLDGDIEVQVDELVGSYGPHAVFIAKDAAAGRPVVVQTDGMFGDVVKYRCDETGSVLLVKTEDALEDAYVCPATGCVMRRVEEPEMRVIKIRRTGEDDNDEE